MLTRYLHFYLFVASFSGGIRLIRALHKLQERYSWKQMDFAFPDKHLKEEALASGDYKPENVLPVSVEPWHNRLFLTIPRWKDGVPATLAYINMGDNVSGSPELLPYPDWQFNTIGDCANSVTSVFYIKADKCGRLWVFDQGILGVASTARHICPYAINVFDLHSNQRIRRYELPSNNTKFNTFVATVAVDIDENCDDTYAYFADEIGYGLIVYSWKQNKSWRFEHSYFHPDPLLGDFNITGLNFQWHEEGIFGMSLSPKQLDGYRTMYFSPFASHHQFAISTRVLRNESRVSDSFHNFVVLGERAPKSHINSRVMSDNGIELFALVDQNAIGCWNSSEPYAPKFHDTVANDDVGLVFPTDVKIDENNNVWVISDRMHIHVLSKLDYNDINFRIYTAPLSELIEGTICDQRSAESKTGSIRYTNPPINYDYRKAIHVASHISPFQHYFTYRTQNIPKSYQNFFIQHY